MSNNDAAVCVLLKWSVNGQHSPALWFLKLRFTFMAKRELLVAVDTGGDLSAPSICQQCHLLADKDKLDSRSHRER